MSNGGRAWSKTVQAYIKANPWCYYCGNVATTIDHVIPLKLGGSNSEENYVPACRSCNSSKGAKLNWKPKRTMQSDRKW